MSPERYALIPLALLAGLVFIRLPDPGLALVAWVPYAALANLEGIVHPSGQPYPSEVVLLAALAVVPWRAPRSFRFRGAARLALGFGLWMAIAAWVAAPHTDSAGITRLVRLGFLAATLFALGHETARARRGNSLALDAALGAAALMAALSLVEGAVTAARGGGLGAIGSVVGGPELLALHLTLLAPPGLALAALGRDSARTTWVLGFLIALALAASFSRAGWAGGWAAILGMGLLARKAGRPGAGRLLALALLAAGMAIMGAVLLVVPGSPLAPFGERLRELSPASLLAARRADWLAALRVIGSHPLFGQMDAPNAYNLFLGLAAQSGLVILIPFLALLGSGLKSGAQVLRARGPLAPEAVGLMGAVIGLCVTGIGESTLGSRLTPSAFLLLGLLQGTGDIPSAPDGPRAA